MDFQSAMETFAEAWVAANTGKFGLSSGTIGSVVSSLAAVASPMDFNKAAESIHQQMGKGVGGGSSIYSPQQQQPIENGGLDYPKIHSSGSITPVSLPTGAGVGGGMDLSPASKRIKGFSVSPSSVGVGLSQSIPVGMGHSSASTRRIQQSHPPNLANHNHLQEFDPGLLLGGHHPSAANAVLVGKSLPIHCVIEVSDGGSNKTNSNSSKASDRPAGKVETGESGSISGPSSGGSSGLLNGGMKVVEVDDFVIIPAGTPFQEVVTTVLTLLGYPKDTIQQAEGSILLKNWKPLKLDQVCDSPHKTVGDILNDLTNHATLRVLVTRPKNGTAEDLKEKLLRLLLAQSSNMLMGSGCPLDEVTLGQLVKGQWPQNLAEDVKRRFDQWYSSHQQKLLALEHHHPPLSHSTAPHQVGDNKGNNGLSANNSVTSSHQHQHSHLVNGSSGIGQSIVSARHHLLDKSTYDDDSHTNHPVFHGLATQKTRMRTSFDPEMELPRLQQWFAENPHPSRHQIQQYVRELNTLDCRKDRKPLDLNNVIYWFKNARAAQKRNELRYNGYSPNHGFPHHHLQSQNQSNLHLIGSEDMNDNHLRMITDERDERDYMNENSRSSCPDSDDHDQEMKAYREAMENEDSVDRQDNHNERRESINKLNEECENDENKIMTKEEHDEDFISVDVELTEGTGGNVNHGSPGESCNNNEPKDLSGKSQPSGESSGLKHDESIISSGDKKEIGSVSKARHPSEEPHEGCLETGSNHSTSSSVSPRSSPGMSPTHPYDFSGAPSMVSRFHPFFDHPFMAYRHFNSFNFGQNFPGSNVPDGHSPSAYESALGMVGRKGMLALPPAKPSAGMEVDLHFPNGPAMLQSRGSSGSMVISGGGEHLSRMRGEELFASRSASSAEFISSIINSNRSDLGLSPLNLGTHHQNPNSLALDERRKRNRTFIDPVTEVPRLEQWFTVNTHPSHNLILKYTEELNRMPYRQKFPKLEAKNCQFWFKNRRAKCKRLKMTL